MALVRAYDPTDGGPRLRARAQTHRRQHGRFLALGANQDVRGLTEPSLDLVTCAALENEPWCVRKGMAPASAFVTSLCGV